MRKTLVTILCSALIAASSIQAAAAAERHHARAARRKPVMVNDQHRNSNNEQHRDSNAGGVRGLFPGHANEKQGQANGNSNRSASGMRFPNRRPSSVTKALEPGFVILSCSVVSVECGRWAIFSDPMHPRVPPSDCG
jgi:Ni/Co efflux regulator RcnB